MTAIREKHIVRVNRFSVPVEARDEFLRLIKATHEVIRAQPGFIDDMILEQQSGIGLFNLLTVLQFEGEHVLQSVITAVARFDEATGINRQALTRRLGVETSVGFYRHAGVEALIAA